MWNKLKEFMTIWLEKLEAWALKDRKFSLVVAGLGGIILAVGIYWFFICLDNDILRGSLTIVFLGLPTFFILWLFRTHDVKEQIDKTQENTNNSSFFEAAHMLTEKDALSWKIALEQLSFLKTKTGFDKEKINLLTRRFPLNEYSISDAKKKKVFVGATLKALDLSRANLAEFNLNGANLQNTCLGLADLQNTYLVHTELQNAYLVYAKLQHAILCGAKLQNTRLWFAKLQHADLRKADLQNTNLRSAQLQNADLSNAKLQNANLKFAQLQNAHLFSADLTNADLRGADLCGAAFKDKDERTPPRNATVAGAKWKGAIYNDDTKLPDGFDPKKEGMVYKPSEQKITLTSPAFP